ncbi:MAG: hypothetical protein ACUVX8_10700 [Candidatus Zipacnadales bacterium]
MLEAEVVLVECDPLRLGFDRHTGQWVALYVADNAVNLLGGPAPMDVEVEAVGQPWPARNEWVATEPAVTDQPGETIVEAVPPLWRCGRPAERGYWGTPAPASLWLVAIDGRGVEVQVRHRRAIRRVRLDDSSGRGEQPIL